MPSPSAVITATTAEAVLEAMAHGQRAIKALERITEALESEADLTTREKLILSLLADFTKKARAA